MKTRRIAAAVLFTFLPATIALPAWSQGDDAVTIQARTRFREGVDAFDKGKYEEARLAFLQAYTLKKHPAVLLNLAQSSAKSNHPLEAAKYFQQFLKEASTASPQQRKDAETGLAEVRQKLGRIDVVAPAGTEISLDDQGKVGTTPMEPIDVEPGSHAVKSPTQSVVVNAVVGQKVEARLGSTAATPAPAPIVAPPAQSTPGETTAPQETPVTPDRAHAKRTNLLTPPENMLPVWVGLGAAGAGLIGGIVFAVFKSDAQSKANTVAESIRAYALNRQPPEPTANACNNPRLLPNVKNSCDTLEDNNDKVNTNATIANVSFVVMGAGLLLAGVWYLAGPKKDDAKKSSSAAAPQRPIITPWAGWNTGGLSIAGQF